jgi:hypothetical protein
VVFIKVIIIIIILVLVFIVRKLAARKSTGRAIINSKSKEVSEVPTLSFDATPDVPVGFGYKSQWIAVKTTKTEEIAKELNLTNIQAANWSTGIEGAYEGYYFISPPVKGWTIVVNALMPDLTDSSSEMPLNIIQKLSAKYEEAYYFGSHRVVEYYAYAKAVKGELVRAYAYLGESGETVINLGELSSKELIHNFNFTDLDDEDPHLPDEEHIIVMSKEWAIDPLMEDSELKVGVGLVGQRG